MPYGQLLAVADWRWRDKAAASFVRAATWMAFERAVLEGVHWTVWGHRVLDG